MAIKLTKRKGFNFFRSYYDVYNELETDAEKVAFMDALLDRQFLGIKPTNLTGMAKFAYISQTNSIDSQVKGYEDKTKIILNPTDGGSKGANKGGSYTPTEQVEVKEKEEVQDKLKILNNSLLSEIKISDDKKFFLVKDLQFEITEEKLLHYKTALGFQKLFIKNLKEKNSPTSQTEKATYKNFVEPIRLIFEKKEATKEQLREAYEYLNSKEGEFWKSNILSTKKLREKLSMMILKKNTKVIDLNKKEVSVPDPNKRRRFS